MLKEKIYKIPVIGPLAIKIYRRLTGKKDFTTSNKYWEDRYKAGGNSGTGSYNELASFKGEIINEFVSQNNVESVIEFGCGDGNQLKYFKFKSYTGFDISPTIIESCIKLYKSDPSKQFRLMDTPVEHKVDLTMSLDVIYHLVEDQVYLDYMAKVFASSNKYVIVYSSDYDEKEYNALIGHVKHRKFSTWVEKNAPEFKLIKHIPNKFPYNGDGEVSSLADFFIFEK